MKIRTLDGFKLEIEARGHRVVSDQPQPRGGDAGMTPVELLAGALGGCVAVYALDYLRRNDLPTAGVEVEVDWTGAEKPHRIGAFAVSVRIPVALTERQRASLQRIVQGCTVHNTLHHPPAVAIELATGER